MTKNILVKSDEEFFKSLIEKDFQAIEKENFMTDKALKEIFGKYGWDRET